MTKQQKAEQAEALEQLRGLFPPGNTVHTILRHVSRSGMSRAISVVVTEDGEPRDVSWLVARAGLGKFDRQHDGVKIGGCGMDMGFALVYDLSRTLNPDGFGCIGKGCPSNDHANGDPLGYKKHTKRAKHWHSDGGYALPQRWL